MIGGTGGNRYESLLCNFVFIGNRVGEMVDRGLII